MKNNISEISRICQEHYFNNDYLFKIMTDYVIVNKDTGITIGYVSDNAMSPAVNGHSFYLLSEIDNNNVIYGNNYFIVTMAGVVVRKIQRKYLYHYFLESNDPERYQNFEIRINCVRKIYRIIGESPGIYNHSDNVIVFI